MQESQQYQGTGTRKGAEKGITYVENEDQNNSSDKSKCWNCDRKL